MLTTQRTRNGFDPTRSVLTLASLWAAALPQGAEAQRVHFEPLYSIPAESNDDIFGFDIAATDDVSGDGKRDLIIGAPFAGGNEGACYLYEITLAGASVLHKIEGIGDTLGWEVQSLTDINGDDVPDYAVGAPRRDSDDGRVVLVSGADRTIGGIVTAHPAVISSLTRAGSRTGERLGFQSGLDQLLLVTREDTGHAYFIDPTSLNDVAEFEGGGIPGVRFTRIDETGFVGGVGDVIGGDGVVDVAITQQNNLNGTLGTVLIVDGATMTASSTPILDFDVVELVGLEPGDQIGTTEGEGQPTIAVIDDLNGDGVGELAVGAFTASINGSESGSVIVYDPTDGSPIYRIDGEQQWDWLGNTVVALQDLNSDGVTDFGVGVPGEQSNQSLMGRCHIHSGIDGKLIDSFTDGMWHFCSNMDRLSDLNGDGFDELAVANQRLNIVHVYQSFICGDGVIDPGEDCDDNGESATCDDDCTPVACGDGVVNESAGEACDDRDTDSGDGCSATCGIETGYVCFGEPSACDTVCGDEIVAGDEECDGGAANSDSIPDACRTNCRAAFCGDGVVDSGEDCDDMNANEEDLCLASCQFNPAIPTVSQWGVAATALLLLIAGTTIMRRGAWSYGSALE